MFLYFIPGVVVLTAILYVVLASLGAGFLSRRKGWLAGTLSVILGVALYGIVTFMSPISAPVAFLFSLFIASIIATQLHQAFRPQSLPVEEFNGLISLRFPEVLAPLAVALVIGAIGGWVGERVLPTGSPPRRG